MALAVEPFLTAYDPTDLPGTSIDPLGFERGYLLLADKVLPGLTNVASRPRYFSVFCAGIFLADVDPSLPKKKQFAQRQQAILRLERLWALANVAASASDADLPTIGIRGYRYALAHFAELQSKNAKDTETEFKMLIRQVPYGVIGIYGAVAEGLRLVDRDALVLTPGRGLPLAEAFVEETKMPAKIQSAVAEGGRVPLAELAAWGKRAHVSLPPTGDEARLLREALRENDTRTRTTRWLAKYPALDDDTELARVRRIVNAMQSSKSDPDLLEAFTSILAYEDSFAWALLAFERLLYLCRDHGDSPFVPPKIATTDDVVQAVAQRIPTAVNRLCSALDDSATPAFRTELETLHDVRVFLQRAAGAPSTEGMIAALVDRHAEVQRGKFDRGRRKAPWIESTDKGLALSLSDAGQLKKPQSIDQIARHPYRFGAADAFLAMGK